MSLALPASIYIKKVRIFFSSKKSSDFGGSKIQDHFFPLPPTIHPGRGEQHSRDAYSDAKQGLYRQTEKLGKVGQPTRPAENSPSPIGMKSPCPRNILPKFQLQKKGGVFCRGLVRRVRPHQEAALAARDRAAARCRRPGPSAAASLAAVLPSALATKERGE
jgi:hypothetical protein